MQRRICAFCGATQGLTNEHVVPNFLYEKNADTPFINIANTPSGDKAVGAELRIGDVCSTCNHGELSRLDGYAAQLYDQYFSRLIRAGDRVRFSFDFDILSRWLLKVGYNLARSRNWTISPGNPMPAYIIGRTPRPPGLRLFVQLIVPTEKGNAVEIPPPVARADLLDLKSLPGFSMAFRLSLKCFWFYVFNEKQLSNELSQRRETYFTKFVKSMKSLERTIRLCIPHPSISYQQLHKISLF